MPNHEEHCRHSEKMYRVRGDDLHSWMDAPSLFMGREHRIHRHDPKDLPMAVKAFGHKYGEETVKQIFLDHIWLDKREREASKQYAQPESELDSIQGDEEPSSPQPNCSSHSTFPSDFSNWGILEIAGAITIVLIVLWILNTASGNPIGSWWTNGIVNPIGLWWSQYWLISLGVIVLIPLSVVIIHAFRVRNNMSSHKKVVGAFLALVFLSLSVIGISVAVGSVYHVGYTEVDLTVKQTTTIQIGSSTYSCAYGEINGELTFAINYGNGIIGQTFKATKGTTYNSMGLEIIVGDIASNSLVLWIKSASS